VVLASCLVERSRSGGIFDIRAMLARPLIGLKLL
jgi:hypothetical protein